MIISDYVRELLMWLLLNPRASLEEVIQKAAGIELSEEDLETVMRLASFESRVDPLILGYNTRVRFEFNTQVEVKHSEQSVEPEVEHVRSHPSDLALKVYKDFFQEFGEDSVIHPLYATYGVSRDACFEVLAKGHAETALMRSYLQAHLNVKNLGVAELLRL